MTVATCPIPRATKPAIPRTCWGCGKDLSGTRKQKWCSPDCQGHDCRWTENHKWWAARPAALKAAQWSPGTAPDLFTRLAPSLYASALYHPESNPPPRRAFDFWMQASTLQRINDHAGAQVAEYFTLKDNYLLWECGRCGSLTDAPEVNHRDPWVDANGESAGNRNDASCKNHQENLEVLDHHCHQQETTQQAQHRGRSRRMERIVRNADVRGQARLL